MTEKRQEKEERKAAFSQRIADRVATLRRLRGMTQEELAQAAGLQRTHINRIEAGKYSVEGWVLQSIAEAMGMTVDLIDPALQDLAPLKRMTE